MKSYEIYRRLSNAEIDTLVVEACKDDEIPDKLAGGVLTYQSIPLKRFAKLPEETRKAYVRRTLRDKRAQELSLYVLSAALTKSRGDLISAFLEAAGLKHDGPSISYEGEIPEPPAKKLKAAVDSLLAGHPNRDVALYLHAFASQPDAVWPHLLQRLEADERLALEDRSAS